MIHIIIHTHTILDNNNQEGGQCKVNNENEIKVADLQLTFTLFKETISNGVDNFNNTIENGALMTTKLRHNISFYIDVTNKMRDFLYREVNIWV